MRLTSQEKAKIQKVFEAQRPTADSSLYLFGSRASPSKRGGDIDLLVVVAEKSDLLNFSRLDFIVDLKKELGERKIDVTVVAASDLTTDPFLISAIANAVLLTER